MPILTSQDDSHQCEHLLTQEMHPSNPFVCAVSRDFWDSISIRSPGSILSKLGKIYAFITCISSPSHDLGHFGYLLKQANTSRGLPGAQTSNPAPHWSDFVSNPSRLQVHPARPRCTPSRPSRAPPRGAGGGRTGGGGGACATGVVGGWGLRVDEVTV